MQTTTSLPILYSFRRCPYAMRARMALLASGTACELREIVLRAKPPELFETSPKGTVPVLVLPDGQVLEESLDIMRWALAQNDPQQWLTPQVGSLQDMLALIVQCDGPFKFNLDRYKYPERYPGTDALAHRSEDAAFLQILETRLQMHTHLFGDRLALADIAIAPFVRQFAHTDNAWFEAQSWPRVQTWLSAILDTPLYAGVMDKYPAWQSGTSGIRFPSQ